MKCQEMLTMNNEEWSELLMLKEAISQNPATVHYEKMERFTELMVKSLEGKGDYIKVEVPTNY